MTRRVDYCWNDGKFYALRKWSSIEINCINYGICIADPSPNYGIFNIFFLRKGLHRVVPFSTFYNLSANSKKLVPNVGQDFGTMGLTLRLCNCHNFTSELTFVSNISWSLSLTTSSERAEVTL